MEKKLANLFDFQHFKQNNKLKSVIQEVEGRYAAALDDDDLGLVSAAGEGGFTQIDELGCADAVNYMGKQPGGIIFQPGLDEGEAR